MALCHQAHQIKGSCRFSKSPNMLSFSFQWWASSDQKTNQNLSKCPSDFLAATLHQIWGMATSKEKNFPLNRARWYEGTIKHITYNILDKMISVVHSPRLQCSICEVGQCASLRCIHEVSFFQGLVERYLLIFHHFSNNLCSNLDAAPFLKFLSCTVQEHICPLFIALWKHTPLCPCLSKVINITNYQSAWIAYCCTKHLVRCHHCQNFNALSEPIMYCISYHATTVSIVILVVQYSC